MLLRDLKSEELADAIEELLKSEFLGTLIQISQQHLPQVMVLLVQMSSSSEKLHFG